LTYVRNLSWVLFKGVQQKIQGAWVNVSPQMEPCELSAILSLSLCSLQD